MTQEVLVRQFRTRPGGRRRSPAPPGAPATGGRAAGPGARGAPRVRPLRVLVVDDCPDTTDSTAELVGLWGHDARRAYAGAAALELAAEYRPDVMLVDLAMRGMDGCEVARQVRRMPGLDGVLLIAVTGYTAASLRREAAAAGFDFYVPKPMDPATLEALLMSRQIDLSATPTTVVPADCRSPVLDDDGMRPSLATGLPCEGFDVWLAANGQEARDLPDEIGRREGEDAAQDDHWRDDGGQGQRPSPAIR